MTKLYRSFYSLANERCIFTTKTAYILNVKLENLNLEKYVQTTSEFFEKENTRKLANLSEVLFAQSIAKFYLYSVLIHFSFYIPFLSLFIIAHIQISQTVSL